MVIRIKDQSIYYTSHGKGLPLIIIHGFYLDSICMERAIEESSIALSGFKRIYIDLPGMGQSPRHSLFNNSDIMLDLVCEFIRALVEDHPFIVMGFSYGGYLAQGVASRFEGQVTGEALICPVVIPDFKKRKKAVITNKEIDEDFFALMSDTQKESVEDMVVINPRAFKRYEADFSRAIALADAEFLQELYNKNYASGYIDNDNKVHNHKCLLLLGYQDSVVGYQDMLDKLSQYPNATVSLHTNASHSFFLEQPTQFEHSLGAWLSQYKNQRPS